MSGYDKFFKEAGKASGLISSEPKKQEPKKKVSFKLNTRAEDKSAKATPSRASGLSPEEQVRLHLKNRIQERKAARKQKRPFPIFPTICVAVAILSSALGYFRPDLADRVFGRIEIGAFGLAQAADEKTGDKSTDKASDKSTDKSQADAKTTPDAEKAAGSADPNAAKGSAAQVGGKDSGVPDVRNWSEEELSFFQKLNERKKELDQREADLGKMEEELQKQKLELDGKIKQLESMRVEISKALKTRVATDQAKVDKLVQVYSNMKPQQASKVIESLNEDLAVEVLDKMKKKNAAEVLDMMDAKKAKRLSEMLTGYQRSPADEQEGKNEE
jgi:flagellar motility protein MotE (MotC chaperone)